MRPIPAIYPATGTAGTGGLGVDAGELLLHPMERVVADHVPRPEFG